MDDHEVVIVGPDGTEHVFPAGFDPKHAAAIVRNGGSSALPTKPVSAEDFTEKPYLEAVKDRFVGAVRHVAGDPGTGALMASAAAIPFTAGMSVVPAAAAMFGAGTLGAAPAAIAKGEPTEALRQGAMAAGGEVAGRGLQMLARGAYRVALAPEQRVLRKYGDVVGEGLATNTPVSKAGLQKASNLKMARMGDKAAALSAADQQVTHSADQIADEASAPLSKYATEQIRAGLPDPTGDFADRLAQFKAANPQGSLKPSSLDAIKGTLDDQAGSAFKKMRMREPLTPTEKGNVEMIRAMSRAQEGAVPGYRAMNRGIMDAEGLRSAIERRTVGSGGNQVLDTLLMLMRGPGGVPGRVAMMPPVLSNAAIAANKVAPLGAPVGSLASLIMQKLGGGTPQQ